MTIATESQLRSRSLDQLAAKPAFVAVVFFVSGFPALLYQLTWQRSLFTIYGINVEAVTVVVAGFLLGLGIGSLAGGQLSRITACSLLALFGAIEAAIGLFGVLSLRIFDLAGAHTIYLPMAGTTLAVLGLLFCPTLLMGSTLPILSAYLIRRSQSVGSSVGLLYCVNTLGSATACFACAFGLMRLTGMQGQVNLAASINFLIGFAALAAAYRTRSRSKNPVLATPHAAIAASNPARSGPAIGLVAAVALAALIGYLSLSYEILWFRTFSLANDTASAFALVLGTYLAGIANGSLRAQRLFDRSFSARRAALIVAGAVAAGSFLGFFLLPLTAASAITAFGYLYPMLLMVFAQTTLLGGLFPILCHSGIAADRGAGARVGQVYLGNIIGSVAGTLVTGFVLMDHLSIAAISLSLAEFGIAVAVVLGGLVAARTAWRIGILGVGVAAGLTLAAIAGSLFGNVYEALIYKSAPTANQQFVDVVENKSGVITVSRDRTVFGGGAYDGMIAVDMLDDPNLLIRPFSLSLYHPDPQRVLMIGLATGAWAQVIANHPAVKHLTIVEINPGYIPIIRRYPEVASLLSNPKVTIVIDDGRRWLNRHPAARFDAIVQNTTWNYRPNVTNLLSAEYLRLVAGHLRPGGIALYNTTGSVRAQRTACATFAAGFRELNVMVVGNQRLRLDREGLRAILTEYRIDGHPVFDLSNVRYRARLDQVLASLAPESQGREPEHAFLESCRSILARTRGLSPITDDNMGEEWGYILRNDPLIERLQKAFGL